MSLRNDGRAIDEMREIKLTPGYIKHVPGSVLIEQGDTRVVCTATYETKLPFFLRGGNKGWVQAEYAMIPGSTASHQRSQRERQHINNRNIEIQRFISRSLRTTFDLKKINNICITIDADVIQADGGTRCASLNAGMIVLVKTLRHLVFENRLQELPRIDYVAAVSIGVKDDEILVDLNYKEDSKVDADINIVSSENGHIVQVQAFGEEKNVPREVFHKIIDLGIEKNFEIIKQIKSCAES